jgi:hypothetical protein
MLDTILGAARQLARGVLDDAVRAAVRYLQRYGWLPDPFTVSGAEAVTDVAGVIASFQAAAGLVPTGELTPQTVRVMALPRCGMSDAMMMTQEARWRKNRLSYAVAAYVGSIGQDTQDQILRDAWAAWEAVCDVRVTRVAEARQADVLVSTGRGAAQGFDGSGGTLAWAQLPPGDDRQLLMRFDLDERWLAASNAPGILLLNVACHEFGHLLGLDHSRVSGALMAPFYSAAIARPQQRDDVTRIQAMYGPPPAPPPPPAGKKTVTLEVEGQVSSVRLVGVT